MATKPLSQKVKNGYLIPSSSDQVVDHIASSYAEKIVLLYQNEELANMRQASYTRAEDFLTSRVEEAWAQLIEEVTHAGTYLIAILVKAKTCSTL